MLLAPRHPHRAAMLAGGGVAVQAREDITGWHRRVAWVGFTQQPLYLHFHLSDLLIHCTKAGMA